MNYKYSVRLNGKDIYRGNDLKTAEEINLEYPNSTLFIWWK